MACEFAVMLNAGRPPHGAEAALPAMERVEWLEHLLSVYKSDSELSLINREGHQRPIRVSPDVLSLLEIGAKVHTETEAAFDMTAASLSEVWGFARRQGAMPTSAQIQAAVANVGMDKVVCDRTTSTVRLLKPDVKLNPGGIGKGYAIDQAASILRAHEIDDFLLHGGKSSLIAAGNRYDIDSSEGWRIAVNHPEQPRIQLGYLRLRNVALGTSGPANQFFYYKGVRYGHIIDPRTGWPAQGLLSITVLHPSAAYADALATGLYVLGLEKALAYCDSHPETGFVAILPTKRAGNTEIVTRNLADDTWQTA